MLPVVELRGAVPIGLSMGLPHLPVQINLGIANVRKGLILQNAHGVRHGYAAALNLLQKRFDVGVHFRASRSRRTPR